MSQKKKVNALFTIRVSNYELDISFIWPSGKDWMLQHSNIIYLNYVLGIQRKL